MNIRLYILSFLLSASAYSQTVAPTYTELQGLKFTRPKGDVIIADLMKSNPNNKHPRLYATGSDFIRIKQAITRDPLMSSWYNKIKQAADKTLEAPVYTYEQTNAVIHITRSLPGRLNALVMAYKIEGDLKYAERAYTEMEAISKWTDWGTTKTFLNVADVMMSFAIGYDWCYDAFTTEQREVIRKAIIEKGLKKILKIYADNPNYEFREAIGTVAGSNNWNPWCNGGAAACALAIGDEEPKLAAEVLEKGLRALENWITVYAPDGGSTEGVGYGNGAMSLFVRYIAALESALGTSYNYFNVPGIAEYAYFPIYMNGPVKSLNFHDSGNDNKQYLDVTFFIANKLKKPWLGNMRKKHLSNGETKSNIFDLIWYQPDYYKNASEKLPLDKYFRNVETGSFRSSWEDPNAIFLAFHGGQNWVSHTHLDAGHFNIDAMGLNWALDLGTESLTYIGKPGMVKDHFDLYRLKPEGHNTLLIDPSLDHGQSIHAWNPVIDIKSTPSDAYAKMNITDAYRTQANSAIRTFSLTDNRSKIVIEDELDLKQVSEVWWFMHTRARITVSADGLKATLSQKGKKMEAVLVSPANGKFVAMEAKPMPNTAQNAYQTPNTGIQKLAIKIDGVQKTNIRVELIPVL
jgi:hypothetical protein